MNIKLLKDYAKLIAQLGGNVQKGDEVNITMPGMVTLFDYDGGDLPTAETATIAATKTLACFLLHLIAMSAQTMRPAAEIARTTTLVIMLSPVFGAIASSSGSSMSVNLRKNFTFVA